MTAGLGSTNSIELASAGLPSLCVELDGGIHDEQQDRDEARTAALAHHEIRVIRFRNEEVFSDLPSVLHRIRIAAESSDSA